MSRRPFASLALLILACGADPAPPTQTTTPPATTTAVEPEPSPTPPPLVHLPLAIDGDLPASGTPERALLDRWAHLLSLDLAELSGLTFHAERVEPWLFDGTVVELTGSDSRTPRPRGGVVYVVVPAGDTMAPDAGRVLHVVLTDSRTILADPAEPRTDVPWLDTIAACDDEAWLAVRSAITSGEAPDLTRGCEDRGAALATSVLAIADADSATRTLLAGLARLGLRATSLEIVASEADVPRPLARDAHFVPFAATRDATGLHAAGTVSTHGTCAPEALYLTFTLAITPTGVTLQQRSLARQAIPGHCI